MIHSTRPPRPEPCRFSAKHCRTQSQPQTAQEKQIFRNPSFETPVHCARYCPTRPGRGSFEQPDSADMARIWQMSAQDQTNATLIDKSVDIQLGRDNHQRLNEFVTRQRNLVSDRKTRHRYRKSLGQQHVKEWLGVPITLR
ncbi:unnamed protein product [Echinostoma caproni]|uniref:Uncharacterized protein n=1 Tax=Echinostoma caproni TaxID=27848 RepID=A0A183AFT3_9TREM|nr:unnamed protein product [Echinostoma caproni]